MKDGERTENPPSMIDRDPMDLNAPGSSQITRAFFDRPAPEDYLEEWSTRLAQLETARSTQEFSVLLFRLQEEWLAINARDLIEVTEAVPVHAIPHRTDARLRGLVNIRGQLRICVSLHALLGVAETEAADERSPGEPPVRTGRMIVVADQLDQWVFRIDELVGVQPFATKDLKKVPATFERTSSYCQAVLSFQGRTVGYLDHARLMDAFRSLCS